MGEPSFLIRDSDDRSIESRGGRSSRGFQLKARSLGGAVQFSFSRVRPPEAAVDDRGASAGRTVPRTGQRALAKLTRHTRPDHRPDAGLSDLMYVLTRLAPVTDRELDDAELLATPGCETIRERMAGARNGGEDCAHPRPKRGRQVGIWQLCRLDRRRRMV